jgi:hypothetical protein
MADDLPQAKIFFGMALQQAAAGLREGVVEARVARSGG